MFFEAINAAGVLQIPMLVSVWDDDYGISVPKEYQTTKGNISKILSGFQRTKTENGFEIFTVRGWNYEELCRVYEKAEKICREEHVPVLIHVQEMTQPQGHSTSGSHERYKTKERLEWERAYDCNLKMREWIIDQGISSDEELDILEREARGFARASKESAWKAFNKDIQKDQRALLTLLEKAAEESPEIAGLKQALEKTINPLRLDAVKAAKRSMRFLLNSHSEVRREISSWLNRIAEENLERYSSHVYSQSEWSALKVPHVEAIVTDSSPLMDGREVLQACFDAALKRDPRVIAFGEDVGRIGDVNQGFAGLQQKYGEDRVTDTGIRECTIIGQGIGTALRGLKPIAEIQYLDYYMHSKLCRMI
jgi:2-oxoisovalerate dehydrogenase E1 component